MSSSIYHRVWALSAGLIVIAAVLGLAWAASGQEQGAKKDGVRVGDAMPDFKLKDLDGKEHSLAELKGKPVILVFVSNGCPWSRGADPLLSRMAKDYEAKGVAFFGIDADKNNSPEEIRNYAKEKNVTYRILKDENNRYADAVGAQQTPEVFIVDKDGKLVYHGAVDDRQSETDTGKTNYVSKALDEVMAGKPVSTPEKKQWGCGIKRVPQR